MRPLLKMKCRNVYQDSVRAYSVYVDGGKMIGDLFCTLDFGRNWNVVLCGRLGFSNANFATEEGAMKYMKLVAYLEAKDILDTF